MYFTVWYVFCFLTYSSVAGYETRACDQPESVILMLRLLVTVIPSVGLFLGYIFLWHYPIDEEVSQKNRTIMEIWRYESSCSLLFKTLQALTKKAVWHTTLLSWVILFYFAKMSRWFVGGKHNLYFFTALRSNRTPALVRITKMVWCDKTRCLCYWLELINLTDQIGHLSFLRTFTINSDSTIQYFESVFLQFLHNRSYWFQFMMVHIGLYGKKGNGLLPVKFSSDSSGLRMEA